MAGALSIKTLNIQATGQLLLLLAAVALPFFFTLLVIESQWIPLALIGSLSVLAVLLAAHPR
ncbi:MAG: hypothetical protein JNK38_19345, partial [Acidobacteria bacterium]|nr:hypothetical protein [Acidobacteriota bacterium]